MRLESAASCILCARSLCDNILLCHTQRHVCIVRCIRWSVKGSAPGAPSRRHLPARARVGMAKTVAKHPVKAHRRAAKAASVQCERQSDHTLCTDLLQICYRFATDA